MIALPHFRPAVIGSFSPRLFSPFLWLDAADSSTLWDSTSGGSLVTAGGSVARWEDKSGNARHFTQSTAISRPARQTAQINGLGIVRFDGSNDVLNGPQIITTASFSFFAVVKAAAQQNRNILSQRDSSAAETGRMHFFITEDATSPFQTGRLFFNNGTSYSARSTTTAFDNTVKVLYSQSDGSGNSHVRVNGSSAEGSLTGQNWTPNTRPSQLGGLSTATNLLNGDVAEIIVFPLLSESRRLAVLNYLATKWGVTL